ncbi:BspA family leucine-rich repeat surface protein, partial [Lactococcus sp. S64]|uniref:BspA family leucine-rich repeat surface protein n=1 Tax=Lactococcus sp. S64 TaxID=2767459 RepID=UPI001906381A
MKKKSTSIALLIILLSSATPAIEAVADSISESSTSNQLTTNNGLKDSNILSSSSIEDNRSTSTQQSTETPIFKSSSATNQISTGLNSKKTNIALNKQSKAGSTGITSTTNHKESSTSTSSQDVPGPMIKNEDGSYSGKIDNVSCELSKDGTLTLSGGKIVAEGFVPWHDESNLVKKIIILGPLELTSPETINVPTARQIFCNLPNLTEIEGLENVNTIGMTTLEAMFVNDTMLSTLDLSSFNTSNVTTLASMFSGDSNLISIDGISDWDTSNVTDMTSLFIKTTALKTLDISKWNTSNVISMENMFGGNATPTLDVTNWNTSNVKNMYGIFNHSKATILNVTNWDTSNVVDMSEMFNGASVSSLDVSNWNTQSATQMDKTFRSLSRINELDLSNWNMTNVTSITSFFEGDISLNTLKLGKNTSFSLDSALPEPSSGLPHTGKWINVGSGTKDRPKGSNVWTSLELEKNYDGSKDDDTYVWQMSHAVVNVHDSTIYVGDTWRAEDNFDSAVDKDGNPVDFKDITVDSSKMDTSKAGVYEVTYSYDGMTSTAKVTVKDKQTAVNVHDSTIYVGDTWRAEDNFDSAVDKDGNPVDFK